jgi:hypothetical protein
MLDGDGPWPPGLADLRAAAQAAARPDEVAGEETAVAAFRAAYATPAPAGHRLLGRFVGVKLAAVAAAVLAGGGLAVAAATGTLPVPGGDSPQRPVPSVSPASPGRGSSPRETPTRPATPTPTDAGPTATATAGPTSTGPTGTADPSESAGTAGPTGNGDQGGGDDQGGDDQGSGPGGGSSPTDGVAGQG